MSDSKIALIFAMARNRAIGFNGDIPWHIPDDLKRFKALTLGHPCIMGRKTFESIMKRLGKPLPGRTTIVVSRHGFQHDAVPVFPNLEEAIEAAQIVAGHSDLQDIFICGGAQIYAAALPFADKLYITEVEAMPPGDVFMPEWNDADFHEVKSESYPGDPSWRFVDLQRN